MSRKRTLKKEQKRQEALLAQLEDLSRKGADDELLLRAAELGKGIAASPLAARWAEAADRALAKSLAGGDLGRIERLVRPIRTAGGPPRPLAPVAETVLDLAAGRLEAAQSRLAGLAGPQAAALGSFVHGLSDHPDLRPAADLFTALQRLEAEAFLPSPATLDGVARAVDSLRGSALAKGGEIQRLLGGASLCLSLLDHLAALGGQPSRAVCEWLRREGRSLATVLQAAGPPLLAPLRHTVRLRWRAVLQRRLATEGMAGLAALFEADPGLLTLDLQPEALTGLRCRRQARQLVAAGRAGDLILLLRSRARATSDSGALAVLWGLELWAGRSLEPPEEEEEDVAEEDLAPSVHEILVRLGAMTREIERRFPPAGRPEVARVLRKELFALCEALPFCEHTAEAALSLLEHLPGDLGLLLLGIAGAVAGDDAWSLEALTARLATAAPVSIANDRAAVQRVMAEAAREKPSVLARILGHLRLWVPDGDWPEIAELTARETGKSFSRSLAGASLQAVVARAGFDASLAPLRRRLEGLRPFLEGTFDFSAQELILDAWQSDARTVSRKIGAFLRTWSGLEGALVPFQILENALTPWATKGANKAIELFAGAVIDRLDSRWRLWSDDVPALASLAGREGRRRLAEKIREILAAPDLEHEGRRKLQEALEELEPVPPARTPKPQGKGKQLRMDL